MNPLKLGATAAATTATLALRVMAVENNHNTMNVATKQLRRKDQDLSGMGSSNNYFLTEQNVGNTEEGYIPPWRDPVNDPTTAPTIAPTDSPTKTSTEEPTVSPSTKNPTEIPTATPTIRATTISPTQAPVETIELDNRIDPGSLLETTVDQDSGVRETSCVLMPSLGNFVTEVLDIEYFLYLREESAIDDMDIVQGIVDSTIEPGFHEALVEAGMGCETSNFVTEKYVLVDLSSSGIDLVGTRCDIVDDVVLSNATSCYQVWGQVEATMWFPSRRKLSSGLSTPFGDREAFIQFTKWMEDAFDSLDETTAITGDSSSNSDLDLESLLDFDGDIDVVKASFQGFANVNGFDGAVLERPKDVGITTSAAFMGTAFSVEDDGGINVVFGAIAVAAGSLVLVLAVLFVVVRRRRNQKALFEHAMNVEDLRLDAEDDLRMTPDVVDDASLFREDKPLPEDFKVSVESEDHDYRTCANPSCEHCLTGTDRKQPIFVATATDMDFIHHLSVLKNKKCEEIREKQYESVML